MLGAVGAILLGGDVAYKGDTAEYIVAFGWIKELADACGCPMTRVFVVPGNHDIDRSKIINSTAVRNAQAAIVNALDHHRERELREQFTDPETGRHLLAPLSAYNEFAKLFNCQVYSPDRLGWQQDLPLGAGVKLRLHGLTSTLLCNAMGRPDTRGSLYLSPLQTVFDPLENIVNLALCHHPPEWFMDYDEVDDAICGRASIQLFGHKHRQRILTDHSFIRFSAGALNPDRSEMGWEPAYNLLVLNVEGAGERRDLIVEAHLLKWQVNPEGYVAKQNPLGGAVYRHTIRVPFQQPESDRALPESREQTSFLVDHSPADVEASMSDEGTRDLIFRFWQLDSSQRRSISTALGLIGPDDMKQPEPERYGRALLRAGERGLLQRVAEEVSRLETR